MSAQCPIHDITMTEREGQFGTFWSHKVEADPDYPKGWCNGKPPKGDGYTSSPKPSYQAPAPQQSTGYAEKDWSRVERQHSQEMAIRTVELLLAQGEKYEGQEGLIEWIKSLTEEFQMDLDNKV